MKPKYILQLLLLSAIWGSSFILIRISTPVIGVSLTLGLRIIIAALLMIVVFSILHKLPEYKKFWKEYLVLGLLNMVIPFALVAYSLKHLNASIGSILNATTPLFTMIISAIWLKDKLTMKKLTGLLIGLSGLSILVGWIPVEMNLEVILSLLASLVASFSYGLGAVYTKKYLNNTEPLKNATGQLTAAAVLVLPLMNGSFNESEFTPDIAMTILILAVVCTAFAYVLFFRLIAAIGSTNASTVTLLVPVFSIIWGMIFLREPLTLSLVIGLLLILGSLKLVLAPVK